jgi:hypothetical protein
MKPLLFSRDLHAQRREVAGALDVERRSAAAWRYMQAGLGERDVPTLPRGIVTPVVQRFLARLKRLIRPQAPMSLRAYEPLTLTP